MTKSFKSFTQTAPALKFCTVIDVYINTMKRTFDFNFDFHQAYKRYTHNYEIKEKLSIERFFLFIYKLVILKKLVINQNLNKKVVFIVFTVHKLHIQIPILKRM